MVARGQGFDRLGEKGEGIEKHRSVVTVQSQARKVRHRECSQ